MLASRSNVWFDHTVRNEVRSLATMCCIRQGVRVLIPRLTWIARPACGSKPPGPLAQVQGASTVTETWTLLPGKNYAKGNGLLLRMHGMVVDVLSPPAHLKTSGVDQIQVAANIVKMCGCPLSEETPWPMNAIPSKRMFTRQAAAGGNLPTTLRGRKKSIRRLYPDAWNRCF